MDFANDLLIEYSKKWENYLKCLKENHDETISGLCVDKNCTLEELFQLFCLVCLKNKNLHNKDLNSHNINTVKQTIKKLVDLIITKENRVKNKKKKFVSKALFIEEISNIVNILEQKEKYFRCLKE